MNTTNNISMIIIAIFIYSIDYDINVGLFPPNSPLHLLLLPNSVSRCSQPGRRGAGWSGAREFIVLPTVISGDETTIARLAPTPVLPGHPDAYDASSQPLAVSF